MVKADDRSSGIQCEKNGENAEIHFPKKDDEDYQQDENNHREGR